MRFTSCASVAIAAAEIPEFTWSDYWLRRFVLGTRNGIKTIVPKTGSGVEYLKQPAKLRNSQSMMLSSPPPTRLTPVCDALFFFRLSGGGGGAFVWVRGYALRVFLAAHGDHKTCKNVKAPLAPRCVPPGSS